MKKLVRTNLTNSPTRRGTENLNIQFYSHDRNNAGFEFVVSNESDLTNYTAKVLFNFTDSASTWEANGTIEGNIIKVNFNTNLIARCEEVLGYLFLDSDSDSLDIFKFKFNVVLSEIDKHEVEKRRIKHVENIESLEIVTRAELKDELAKIQTNSEVDLSNYLTTTEAEKIYATKNEIPSINGFATTGDLTEAKKNVIEEIKKLGYAKTTEVPAAYNDSELAGRVTALENRPTTTITSYDDSEVNRRLTVLEARPDNNTVYDDSDLRGRVETLETKQDKDTVYDDSDIKARVETLERRPTVDTTKFITEETLTGKKFVTKDELNTLKPNQTLTLNNNTLSISGGNSVTLPSSQSEMRGTGMPNGVVEAPIGTTYIDTAKTNGGLKWIKTTDGGNTGWKVVEGDTGWVLGWQKDKGDNKNRMYLRRKNDVVHVKFEPKIHDYTITPEVNLILDMGGNDITYNLSIQGFQPIDDILQTFFKKTIDVYSELYNSENSEASQGTGVVVLRYLYNDNSKTGLELLIATSQLGVDSNHVNPFSYLTEDEWPTQLP